MTDNNTALKKAGLKVTLPRLKILEVLQGPDNHHVSAEDLYKRLIDMGEEIGLATVYRVLNQFDDAGIVTRHNFEGGKSVFELTQQHHHDHLICLDCGKVIEFSDESIEARQREIASKHGIRLTNHSLYLYGHCAEGDCPKTNTRMTRNNLHYSEKPTCRLAFFMPAIPYSALSSACMLL
ncbi:transcriptional repressor [Citrobacter amalonaticus]|nr:transcriptional repressor [Citrobacter amalonaticus]